MNSVISFQFYETLAVDSTLHSVNHQNHNIGNTKSHSLGHLDDTFVTPTTTTTTNTSPEDDISNISNISSFNSTAHLNQVRLSKNELNTRNRNLLDRSVEAIGLRGKCNYCYVSVNISTFFCLDFSIILLNQFYLEIIFLLRVTFC